MKMMIIITLPFIFAGIFTDFLVLFFRIRYVGHPQKELKLFMIIMKIMPSMRMPLLLMMDSHFW